MFLVFLAFDLSLNESILQTNFKIQRKTPDCFCNSSDIIVECDVMDKIIFNPEISGNCRNMNCTYKVSSFHNCPKNDLLLSFFVSFRANNTDTLKIYANSTLIKTFDFSDTDSGIHDIHFVPSTNITFNFFSHGFYKPGNVIIKAFSFKYEPGPILNLNSTNFGKSFLIDSINEFSSLTIQGPTYDDFLDLFVAPQLEIYANLDSIRLYDGQGIENFITTLDKLPKNPKNYVPRNIVSKTGTFTLLRLSNNPTFATAFFRLRNEHTAGCLTPENVFSLEQANLTASAGSSGTCMTTILSTATVPFSPTNVLTLLNPTINSNQSFGVIAGIDKNYPYFYFNSQTASLWNSVYLFGTSFSFLLPANQSLEFSYAYTYAQGPEFDILPSKGVFSSANYADDQTDLPMPNISFSIPLNYVMNLEVKYFDFSNSSSCYIETTGEKIIINELGQNIILNAGSSTVVFNETEKGHRGILFGFEVIIPPTTAISTSELTTLSATSTSVITTKLTTIKSTTTSSQILSSTTPTFFSSTPYTTLTDAEPTSTKPILTVSSTSTSISSVTSAVIPHTIKTTQKTTTTILSTVLTTSSINAGNNKSIYFCVTFFLLVLIFLLHL